MSSERPALRIAAVWMAVVPVLLISGCGYTVSTQLTPDTRGTTVAIQPFRNVTRPYEPGLEQQLHSELLDALMTGPYVLTSADEADLLVTGEIERFRQSILSIDDDLDPTEVRITLQVRVSVERRRPRRESWSDTLAPTTEQFSLVGGESLRATTDRAFRQVARDVLDMLVHPDDRWGVADVTRRRIEDLRGKKLEALSAGDEAGAVRIQDEIDGLQKVMDQPPDTPFSPLGNR